MGALSARCCLNQDFQDYQIFRINRFWTLVAATNATGAFSVDSPKL